VKTELYTPSSIGEAQEIIERLLRRNCVIIIAGNMKAEYEGRGASRLTPGDRILIIKQDRAVLLHRPEGYSPINWQPDTSAISVKTTSEGLKMIMIRKTPREILRVVFLEPPSITVYHDMVDQGSFIEYLDEHEIRDILFEHPELLGEGIKPVEKEKPLGDAGYADIYAVNKNNEPIIIEIKRVNADHNAVLQLYRYLVEYKKLTGITAKGVLVAPGFTKQAVREAIRLGITLKQISIRSLYEQYYKKKTKDKELHSLLDYLGVKT